VPYRLKSTEESLSGKVLGLTPVAQEGVGILIDSGHVSVVDLAERGGVSLLGELYQGLLVPVQARTAH